jgi:hypothetical protein
MGHAAMQPCSHAVHRQEGNPEAARVSHAQPTAIQQHESSRDGVAGNSGANHIVDCGAEGHVGSIHVVHSIAAPRAALQWHQNVLAPVVSSSGLQQTRLPP